MAFFKDLGKKIGSAAEATANKAKEVADVTRLNSKINDEEKLIMKLYNEIGEKTFEQEKDNDESPLADLFIKVKSSQIKIQEYKQDIEEAKNPKEEHQDEQQEEEQEKHLEQQEEKQEEEVKE
ncbi:MAG: hypothetical protein AB7V16_01445 [Vulcanibacillus sp.]